jgi:transcriptional regulator with XRE-family HTH domain
MTVPKQVRGTALPYLRLWRKAKGYSVRELGELSGVQYSQISRIENANQHVTPQTIKKLADALSITREELITQEPKGAIPDVTEDRIDHDQVPTVNIAPTQPA